MPCNFKQNSILADCSTEDSSETHVDQETGGNGKYLYRLWIREYFRSQVRKFSVLLSGGNELSSSPEWAQQFPIVQVWVLGFLTGLLAQQSQAVSLEVCGLESVICSPSEVHPGIDERKLVPDERDLTAKQKAELILFHVIPTVITAGIAQGTETSHQSLSQLQYPTFCISF